MSIDVLAVILKNEVIRKELVSQVVAKLIPVLVQRGYLSSVGVVNVEKVASDLLQLFEAAP